MKKPLAFVLGGGGSRGALQVGALKALVEDGYKPDILVGTSIGAANAAFLAVHGCTPEGIDKLVQAWEDAAVANLLPSNYLWLTVRTLFNRRVEDVSHRMANFCINHGITAGLRFGDIQGPRLYTVATDLASGNTCVYGQDPGQTVLEGVLASAAIPPWVAPLSREGQLLMDGGVVSNLPVEPALSVGAAEIIALDLLDSRGLVIEGPSFGAFVNQLLNAVEIRQVALETALAEARGARVRRIHLLARKPVPLWDFTATHELIPQGYELTRQEISVWRSERRQTWPALPEWLKFSWMTQNGKRSKRLERCDDVIYN